MEFRLASEDRSYTTTEVLELVETAGSSPAAEPPRPSAQSEAER